LTQVRETKVLVEPLGKLGRATLAPARRNAASMRALVSLTAAAGVGAIANTARASAVARLVALPPAKAAKNPG